MADSLSIASSACLFLLVLLPLTVARAPDDDCKYGFLPYQFQSPNWPDCLLDKLDNRLNGTYYIRPEYTDESFCPEQPCLTFNQFRDEFFQPNFGYYETVPAGDTIVVFLPGEHTLEYTSVVDLDFIKIGNYTSVTLTGYSPTEPAVVHCNNSGPFFSDFQSVSVTNLWFQGCRILPWQNEALFLNNVTFANSSILDVRFVGSVNISNSNMILGPGIDCVRVKRYGVFYSNISQIMLRDVAISSNSLDCDNPTLFNVNSGTLDIADCTFSGRAVHITMRNVTLDMSGVIVFENGNNAILAFNSTLTLAGNVSFINNTGYQGGAMSLTESPMVISDTAHVVFQENSADYVGGAIFAPGNDISNYVSIGHTTGQQTLESCQISFGENSRVEFINNTATSGGSAIYGITASKLVCNDGLPSFENLSDNLSFEPDDFNSVSSDPLRVCICPDGSSPDCSAIFPEQNISQLYYAVYPGQTFTVPAVIVGFNFAQTSGSVYAQFLNSNASLDLESQYVQEDNDTECFHLSYTILSDKKSETLVLTANPRIVTGIPSGISRDIQVLNENEGYVFFDLTSYDYIPNPSKYYSGNGTFATNQTDGVFRMAGHVPRPLQNTAVFISITLLDCPLGFSLSDQLRRCVCNEGVSVPLTCNINDKTIRRAGTTWINASYNGNSSDGVIVHEHCPFGYCRDEVVDVNLVNPDTQCALDRSGILCGACKPNFSLALGSSRCLPDCSNDYVSLLIIFALAGFALVFFIKTLNLTVSQGTINGLIFYANIVAANRSIFFPVQHNKFLSFLSVFISWLNLDLGIETCFAKGLDGYGKTWLQFVFPCYVWAIAGAIILVSRYSTRATKIFGNTSVSILATLFLFSYIKLLPFIITIFGVVTLVHPDSSSSLVWNFDGNVEYLSREYIPLFLFAMAIVFLLGVPYTAILLLAKWLRTKTHRKGLRWLKPFLDAYYGPFKDRHHYWVGVLLVVRGVLFVFFAAFFAVQSNVNLLLIIVSSILLTTFASFTGRLYKKVYLSVLENSFFVNLGVLAAGTYHVRLVHGSQEALITTSITIAFLQFVGIVLFHSYYFVFIPIRKNWSKIKTFFKSLCRNKAKFQSFEPRLSIPFIENTEVTHSEVRIRAETTDMSSDGLDELVQAKTNEAQKTAELSTTITGETSREAYLGSPKLSDATSRKEVSHTPRSAKMSEAATLIDSLEGTTEQPRYFAAGNVFNSYSSPREPMLFS